jgi:NitT/TauT family transport system permease protein
MTRVMSNWQVWSAAGLALLSLGWLPVTLPAATNPTGSGAAIACAVMLITVILQVLDRRRALLRSTMLVIGAHLCLGHLFQALAGNEGAMSSAFFLLVAAGWLLAWGGVSELSRIEPRTKVTGWFLRLLIPAIFGLWILILWEAVTRGFGIPFILLPSPSAIAARIATSIPTLWADVRQTVFKAVLVGYVTGCLSGFVVAILADRIAFLRHGLLPIANLMSALPIIGVAPIMVMWFGFDWQSKAAVVIIMTFFPMLVNTIAGLGATGMIERDLMRSYASDYWQTLIKLRLPAALPFIFNALKINSTLALIGAIVAEFFGTPIVGMGFRISTEIGRMNVDMVWAEIAVAAVVGSLFYGVVALGERATTFWHPSNRGG